MELSEFILKIITNTNNDDYKSRFLTEYYQLEMRLEKLNTMLEKWDKGTLDFTPTCPRSIYDLQAEYMKKYLTILESRAKMESIKIY